MTKEELEKDYYADRPTEPYSDDDSPNDWANIAHYAEENLEKAFKRIAELEQENAELKSKDCWKSCEYASPKAELIEQHIKDVQNLTKAKEKISKLLEIIKRPYQFNALRKIQLVNEAVQFLSEVEK